MRAALVKDGIVVNIVEAETLAVLPGLVPDVDGTGKHAAIGDVWANGQFTTPLAPVPSNDAVNAAIDRKITALAVTLINPMADLISALIKSQPPAQTSVDAFNGIKTQIDQLRAQKV